MERTFLSIILLYLIFFSSFVKAQIQPSSLDYNNTVLVTETQHFPSEGISHLHFSDFYALFSDVGEVYGDVFSFIGIPSSNSLILPQNKHYVDGEAIVIASVDNDNDLYLIYFTPDQGFFHEFQYGIDTQSRSYLGQVGWYDGFKIYTETCGIRNFNCFWDMGVLRLQWDCDNLEEPRYFILSDNGNEATHEVSSEYGSARSAPHNALIACNTATTTDDTSYQKVYSNAMRRTSSQYILDMGLELSYTLYSAYDEEAGSGGAVSLHFEMVAGSAGTFPIDLYSLDPHVWTLIEMVQDSSTQSVGLTMLPWTGAQQCYYADELCIDISGNFPDQKEYLEFPIYELAVITWGRLVMILKLTFSDVVMGIPPESIRSLVLDSPALSFTPSWTYFIANHTTGLEAKALDGALLFQHEDKVSFYDAQLWWSATIVTQEYGPACMVFAYMYDDDDASFTEDSIATSMMFLPYRTWPWDSDDMAMFGIGNTDRDGIWISATKPVQNILSKSSTTASSIPLALTNTIFGKTRPCGASFRPSSRTPALPHLVATECPAGYYCPTVNPEDDPVPCSEGQYCPGNCVFPIQASDVEWEDTVYPSTTAVPSFDHSFVELIQSYFIQRIGLYVCIAVVLLASLLLVGYRLHAYSARRTLVKRCAITTYSIFNLKHIAAAQADGHADVRLGAHGSFTGGLVGIALMLTIAVGIITSFCVMTIPPKTYATNSNIRNIRTVDSQYYRTQLNAEDEELLLEASSSGFLIRVTLFGLADAFIGEILSPCSSAINGDPCLVDSFVDPCTSSGVMFNHLVSEDYACGYVLFNKTYDTTVDPTPEDANNVVWLDFRNTDISFPFNFNLNFDRGYNNREISVNSLKIDIFTNREIMQSCPTDAICTTGLHPESPWPSSLPHSGVLDLDTMLPDISVSIPDKGSLEELGVGPNTTTKQMSGQQTVEFSRSSTIWDSTDIPEDTSFVGRLKAVFRNGNTAERRRGVLFTHQVVNTDINYEFPSLKEPLSFNIVVNDATAVVKTHSTRVYGWVGILVGGSLLYYSFKGVFSLAETGIQLIVDRTKERICDAISKKKHPKRHLPNTITQAAMTSNPVRVSI